MVNIDTFKQFVEFVSNKVQQGNTTTISQFDMLANRAQMIVYEKDYQTFVATKDISEYLRAFLVSKTTQMPITGRIPFPSNLEHVASISGYNVKGNGESQEVAIEQVSNKEWTNISSSALYKPTLRFPKYTEYGDGINVLPKTLNTVRIDYFKTPIKPKWGFALQNNRPVYDSAQSVNFEWDEFSLNNIAAQYLSLIGVNLKDSELSQFSMMYKQETNSVL